MFMIVGSLQGLQQDVNTKTTLYSIIQTALKLHYLKQVFQYHDKPLHPALPSVIGVSNFV